MAMADVYEAIDGKPYTLDGIGGHMKLRDWGYPGAPYRRIFHIVSKAGRRTKAYRAMREKLRDHWDSDLTESERLVPIIYAILGTAEAERLFAL